MGNKNFQENSLASSLFAYYIIDVGSMNKESEVSQQEIAMSLAVAEAIVQRRKVSWIRYSDGRAVAPYRAGRFVIVGGFVGVA